MKSVINPDYHSSSKEIETIISGFSSMGTYMIQPGRNAIKIFTLAEEEIVVKSFKVPNTINKIVYRFFRKSKAQRSYLNAQRLIEAGIGTPKPIAYFEHTSVVALLESYYICEYVKADLTMRDLIQNLALPNREQLIRKFTAFTHALHENNILFKDHSPGNTLIKKNGVDYDFYLVDLNRMDFKDLSFEERMLNFSRITPQEDMVAIMSDEYAKLTGIDYKKVFAQMWGNTAAFQEKFYRKKRWKKRFKL